MWDKVLKAFRDNLAKAESSYLTKAKSKSPTSRCGRPYADGSCAGFDCTDEENETALASLRKRAWLALRAKVDEQTTDAAFLTKLRMYFEERFRYDENNVPRVWRPGDDIDGAFKKARDQVCHVYLFLNIVLNLVSQTLELVPIYARIQPVDPTLEFTLPSETSDSLTDAADDFDFPATLVIFTETKILDIMARFRRDADAYYVEAKRSTVSSVAQIPYWMYGVLVVLGWNEAMAVLFNPLYFAMLALLLGFA